MNIILVERDCQKFFPEESQLISLLQAEPCRIIFWDPTTAEKLEAGSRCILITAMSSGVRRTHRELFRSNPEVRSWIVAVLDVTSKSEQRQLVENLDGLLAHCKSPVTILFDNHDLQKTAKACARPLVSEKVCLICSGDETLAHRCAQVLAAWLEGWQFEINQDCFDLADMIFLAGTKDTDFSISAPAYGMGRCCVWIGQSVPAGGSCRKAVMDVLTQNGWNFMSRNCVYESNLEMEAYASALAKGSTDTLSLTYEPAFVICDAYGLPLRTAQYNAETITEFLQRNTCFAELTSKF